MPDTGFLVVTCLYVLASSVLWYAAKGIFRAEIEELKAELKKSRREAREAHERGFNMGVQYQPIHKPVKDLFRDVP
jgi:hypothetical protein